MSIGADLAIAKEVVQQDIFARQLMLIRRDTFTEHRDVWIAVADVLSTGVGHIAEDLIVGAILLDDVKHVLDGTRLADFIGNHAIAGDERAPQPRERPRQTAHADRFARRRHWLGLPALP